MPFDNEATAEYALPLRLPPPECEAGDIVLAAPQEMTNSAHPNQLIRFLPIVTAVATVAAMTAASAARWSMARNPMFLVLPLMMLVSALATVFSGSDRRRGELDAQRADYLGYLAGIRSVIVKTAATQRESSIWSDPDPETVWTVVGGRRMWERRAEDPDFCRVRIGVGTVPLARRLIAPAARHRQDPMSVAALERFIAVHSTVSDVPISVSLRAPAVVTVRGDAVLARGLVRAMVCHLAVMHSPAAVGIAAIVDDRSRPDWEWLKWLPHNRHSCASDEVGPVRMVYQSTVQAREALDLQGGRTVVVVVDGGAAPHSAVGDGVTLLSVDGGAGEPVVVTASGEEPATRNDRLSGPAALACAQRLSGYRPARSGASQSDASWLDLVGIDDIATYRPSGRRRSLRCRVPIGVTAIGTTVELDIKEAAAHGMGPHGLCIGATGSGKSEFLRTVALGMIVGHSADELNLVLVDFKGGATFSGLEPAPHVAAVITNLSDKAALVARMRDALLGEMNRRQEVLRHAGNLDGITSYRRRQADGGLEPLPTLLVIVDEFSELLSQHPDFADVFATIGRQGRSLGVHLLLASQRLDEGRLRGLESHLSYRVCLKTLSASESRTVLGSSAAYELPAVPGAAYLRVGTDAPIEFRAAFVSGPTATNVTLPSGQASALVREFTAASVGPVVIDRGTAAESNGCLTVLQAIVERLSGDGPRAHEIWLPPLEGSPTLDAVLREAGAVRPLAVPIGIVDRPFDQRRAPLIVDLSGAAGNVALVGAPQSGKSTALRSLVTALAVTHDPRMVQFYCLDFGGGSLASLRDWPHLGSVAGRADPDRVRRTIARLDAVIRSREKLFREHDIASMARYRQLKVQREPWCDGFGDIFLVVDGWLSLQREFATAEQSITALAAEGLSYGVHVVIAATRWPEIRPALRDQLGTRIELRLGDPADSELDRRRAHQVPEGSPGRGISHDGMHMVIASPAVGEMSRGGHDGWTAPPIPVLPRLIEQSRVVDRVSGAQLVIGVDEAELRPLAIDVTQQWHLIILGDSECGKTATLRTLCRELIRTMSPALAQLFIVDPRRTLLDAVDAGSASLGGYLASAAVVTELLPRVIELLRGRRPPPDVTAAQLRDRSWWAGPEIYFLVDDYDVLGGDALAPLLEVLPYARDVGLHLVVARRCSGAARAMFEPLLAGLRDAGCLTLLMSGSPDEGVTIGAVRPSPQPPGRGVLIPRRGDPQLIQVGWTPSS